MFRSTFFCQAQQLQGASVDAHLEDSRRLRPALGALHFFGNFLREAGGRGGGVGCRGCVGGVLGERLVVGVGGVRGGRLCE